MSDWSASGGRMRLPRFLSIPGLGIVGACALIAGVAILGNWKEFSGSLIEQTKPLIISYFPWPALRLYRVELSEKDPEWSRMPADVPIERRLLLVKGADLRDRDLSGAFANFAFLAKAELKRAKLHETYLQWANLHGADLQKLNSTERISLRQSSRSPI